MDGGEEPAKKSIREQEANNRFLFPDAKVAPQTAISLQSCVKICKLFSGYNLDFNECSHGEGLDGESGASRERLGESFAIYFVHVGE